MYAYSYILRRVLIFFREKFYLRYLLDINITLLMKSHTLV